MKVEELQAKYQILLAENLLLKEELKALKGGVAATELPQQDDQFSPIEPAPINIIRRPTFSLSTSTISSRTESAEKIRLFMSLFKGREDVYARRWENGMRIVVVTRGVKEYGEKDQAILQGTVDILQDAGVKIIFRPNIHQKFAVMDQKTVWYGSINLLSFGSAEESIMRLESPLIANELIKTVHNS